MRFLAGCKALIIQVVSSKVRNDATLNTRLFQTFA